MSNTNQQKIRVLLVEDDEYDRFAFLRAVERQHLNFETSTATSITNARELLSNQDFDIGIIDHNIGSGTAFDLFDDLGDMPFIIVTGGGDEELAVQALKMGAYDYLVKDLKGNYLKTLEITIQNALLRKQSELELIHYRENLETLVHARTVELSQTNEQLRHEIAERKQAEEMIHLQAAAMTVAANGITIFDLSGKIIWSNPAFCRIIGCTEDGILGQTAPSLFASPENDEKITAIQQAITEQRAWTGEISNRRPDGSFYTVELSTTPVLNEAEELTHFTLILHDITERVKSQKLLEYMATHDNLTNLPNRLLFGDRTQHAMTNARRKKNKLAVLFLDLDDFKAVNDAFSHTLGDEVLVLISDRILDCLRESDTVARIGGDEFAILLENIDKAADAGNVAEKIIQAISAPLSLLDNQFSLSASIGISIYPDDGEQVEQLIQNADAAMYRSKDLGKNNYQFYIPDMTREVQDRLNIISQLKSALMEDRLELYYQPQVDIESGKIIGLEALLRFDAPGKGFISPSVFIPIAEKAGFVVELGEWVLNKACQQRQEFANQGYQCQLSVNISGKQLNHPSLVPAVAKALENSGLLPNQLELEITENNMFENIDTALGVIQELKELGVRIALDDFGTGYSSLGYLTQLALDTIKIDKSFAFNITQDPNRMAVVQGMVAIAKALNVPVVVEGVETKEQYHFFDELGCKIIQGFFFSPPVPTSQIPALMNKRFIL